MGHPCRDATKLDHSTTRLFHTLASLGIFSSERRVVAQTYKHLFGRTGEVLCCRVRAWPLLAGIRRNEQPSAAFLSSRDSSQSSLTGRFGSSPPRPSRSNMSSSAGGVRSLERDRLAIMLMWFPSTTTKSSTPASLADSIVTTPSPRPPIAASSRDEAGVVSASSTHSRSHCGAASDRANCFIRVVSNSISSTLSGLTRPAMIV